MGRILDHNYVLRVSWIFEEEGSFMGVYDSMYEDNKSIREWRRRSNLDSVMILQVMLEVAKAIQYLNSMDVLLDNAFDLDNMYLDSKCHVKIFPYGSILPSTLLSSEEVHQDNISILGHTFYELYFDVYRPYFKDDKCPVRPSDREINDELWQVIQRCCAADPKSRPTIDEVVQEMETWKLD
ncbi:hypothetical protein M378DRAFT_12880 [Amanita muscaria Koide BX008]|uniref:Protein kinase domain-containing protein n=1 Tax=Amanita muscaria (strain Koide BX008) TaxID=946122 RepID=A0A0C2X155_AMAMK|nr:hypothetical protein M378DRAFT_12880 [Amanita muscaria Koide BX008]